MTLRMPRQDAAILTAAYHMHSFVVFCLGDNFFENRDESGELYLKLSKIYLAGEISNANDDSL